MKYKYWMYYLKSDNSLYAYTPDEDISKLFESQRNMEMFHVKKKKLLQEDVSYLADRYQTRILEEVSISIYDSDADKEFSEKFALTTLEKLDYMHNLLNAPIHVYTYVWESPYIFNKEILQALDDINYVKYHDAIATKIDDNNTNVNIMNAIEENSPLEKKDAINYYNSIMASQDHGLDLHVDQLAILVKTIGRSLR